MVPVFLVLNGIPSPSPFDSFVKDDFVNPKLFPLGSSVPSPSFLRWTSPLSCTFRVQRFIWDSRNVKLLTVKWERTLLFPYVFLHIFFKIFTTLDQKCPYYGTIKDNT